MFGWGEMIKGERKWETRVFAWRKRKWGGRVFSLSPSFKRKKSFLPSLGRRQKRKVQKEWI